MNLWYLIAAPAWFFVLITAGARLADMGRDEWSFPDHVRRVGLTFIGTAALLMLATPFAQDGWLYANSTWRGVLLGWGWTFVWVTSPNMPPWWDTIIGVHRRTEDWKGLKFRQRLAVEWRTLRSSFKPRRYKPPLAGPKGPIP